MKKKLIKTTVSGLKCDNPNCNWVDMSIPMEEYPKWVGAKCPKCGEVVLTEADFKAIKKLLAFTKFINMFSFLAKEDDSITKMKLSSDGNGNISVDSISAMEDETNE